MSEEALPYRFLRNYEFTKEDVRVFRGRSREAACLFTEITTRHLVVLFAPTGTGKSSLINAAVRPQLEEADYKTLYIKPKQDVRKSIRDMLAKESLLESSSPDLATQLRAAAKLAGQPVVLFLDQFEEFFLYSSDETADTSKEFVQAVAALYRDRSSGVHFFFSLREDYLADMDIFRDDIPNIFQANSTLRLRPFDREAAREVIVDPARAFGVEFVGSAADPGNEEANKAFVDHILDDLQETGPHRRISPIHLQIVCDTLWRERHGGVIERAIYDRLGGVKCILPTRFRSDFAGALKDEELALFEKLMPLLRSDERGAKKILPIGILGEQLGTTDENAAALVSHLLSLRLLHGNMHGTIEWASDYLSGHQDELLRSVRSILFERALTRAWDRAQSVAAAPAAPATDTDLASLYMTVEEFRTISNGWMSFAREAGKETPASLVVLTPDQIKFLFEASLEHGEFQQVWYREATARNIDVIPLLRQKLFDRNARTIQAENAIWLLAKLRTPEALEVLRETLNNTVFGPSAAAELGSREGEGALNVLKEYFHSHTFTPAETTLMTRNWTESAKALLSSRPAAPPQAQLPLAPKPGAPAAQADSGAGISSPDWELVLRRIRDGRVVPVIGSGAVDRRLARALADELGYPLEPAEFAAVAEFAVFMKGRIWVSEFIGDYLHKNPMPPHTDLLAELPIPVFITTRFDDRLVRALRTANKSPQQDFRPPGSPGHKSGEASRMVTPDHPIVYHLQGRLEDFDSLVLTVSDRFNLVASAAQNGDAVPPAVKSKFHMGTPIFLDFEPGATEVQLVSTVFHGPKQTNTSGFFAPVGAPNSLGWSKELLKCDSEGLGLRAYSGSTADFVNNLVANWRRSFS